MQDIIIQEIQRIQQSASERPVKPSLCPICKQEPVLYHPRYLDNNLIVLGCENQHEALNYGRLHNTASINELIIGWNEIVETTELTI